MADMPDVSLLDFSITTVITPSDLLYIGVVDTSVQEGYNDASVMLSTLGAALLNDFSYPLLLETTSKSIIGAINELNANMPSDIENTVFPIEEEQEEGE